MKRKPGRPRSLTMDAIVTAALADGIAEFSMPSVARRLGVAHSGLYRYVTDRDDLVVRAIGHAVTSVSWPDADLDWRELFPALGESVWAVCDAHPGYDLTALTAPYWPTEVVELMRPYIESLHRQGFSVEDAAMAIDSIGTLVLTCSAEAVRLRKIADSQHSRELPGRDLKGFDLDEMWTGRGWYDRKLETLIDGLERRLVH